MIKILIFFLLLYINNNSYAYNNELLNNCIISKVDDWDTANFVCDNIELNNIRFAGIDTPDYHPWEKEQCYYNEAKEYIKSLKEKWDTYSIQIIWKDLCKDSEKWCRPVWIITNNKTKKSIWEELTKKWFAFYWLNEEFNIPKNEAKKLIKNVLIAKYKKLWLWWKCEIIKQEENINIWNSSQAIPPIRTNYIEK